MPLTPNGQGGYTQTTPIKYYTAVFSQHSIVTNSGTLVIGKTYTINELLTGDDFANVGYVSDGTPFVATGTTPTDWTHFTKVRNDTNSTITVTELQNTLGGTVEWTRTGRGNYEGQLTGAFPNNKTYIANTDGSRITNYPISFNGPNDCLYYLIQEDADTINLQVYDDNYNNIDWSELEGNDGKLYLPEIKIYP